MDYETLLKQYNLINNIELSPEDYIKYFSFLITVETDQSKIEEYQMIIELLLNQKESGD